MTGRTPPRWLFHPATGVVYLVAVLAAGASQYGPALVAVLAADVAAAIAVARFRPDGASGDWIAGVLLFGPVAYLIACVRWRTRKKKRCPECSERVRAEARVCRFCGSRFARVPG
jgi:hypothetical protein